MNRDAHIAKINKYIRVGDTVTHTRCMGCIEEHIYTKHDGIAICGKPTKDTLRIEGCSKLEVNDIHPMNVTHLNRIPVEALDVAVSFADRRD